MFMVCGLWIIQAFKALEGSLISHLLIAKMFKKLNNSGKAD
jgi:hypothetical protein